MHLFVPISHLVNEIIMAPHNEKGKRLYVNWRRMVNYWKGMWKHVRKELRPLCCYGINWYKKGVECFFWTWKMVHLNNLRISSWKYRADIDNLVLLLRLWKLSKRMGLLQVLFTWSRKNKDLQRNSCLFFDNLWQINIIMDMIEVKMDYMLLEGDWIQ